MQNLHELKSHGYIMDIAQIYLDYSVPLRRDCDTFIEHTTVFFDHPEPDQNAEQFGQMVYALKQAICKYMILLFDSLHASTDQA